MSERVVATEHIVILPSELDDVHGNIKQKLKTLIGTCTRMHGYVMGVESAKIINNMVSRVSGECIFKVEFTFTSLLPQAGHVFTSAITGKFKESAYEGIFAEYKGIKIIVPLSHSIDFNVGDLVDIHVDVVQYSNHAYQCIGSIKDKNALN